MRGHVTRHVFIFFHRGDPIVHDASTAQVVRQNRSTAGSERCFGGWADACGVSYPMLNCGRDRRALSLSCWREVRHLRAGLTWFIVVSRPAGDEDEHVVTR